MSESERLRRLQAIADILARPEVPIRLRDDLEKVQAELAACAATQARAARSWQMAASRAATRRAV